MAKKISYKEFKKRFDRAHPDCDVEIQGYTAITKEVVIKCKICGKIKKYSNGNRAITNYICCGSKKNRLEQVKQWLSDSPSFEFIRKKNNEEILVKHLECGNIYKKNIRKFFSSPDACPICKTKNAKLRNSIQDAQKELDKKFDGQIILLQYLGRHEKCRYRCVYCNQIFVQKFDCLLGSSGCPKCDRKKSQGEKQLKKILLEHGLYFKEQVSVSELARQHFDFCVYCDVNMCKPAYFIEVQGEQHFHPVEYWGGEEKFQRVIQNDNRKRRYCQENNIPLYEIIYRNKQLINLEILPFF